MLHSKDIIFFSLVFVIMLITVLVSRNKDSQYNLLINIVIVLLSTLFLFGIYWKGNLCDQSEPFTFEVTPAKLCEGGPYMHQSGPNKEMCEKLMSTPTGRVEYDEYNCVNPAFNGRPVHFEYTPLSNGNWQNERCSGSLVGTPKVL
jgi:hypothetical protein